MTQKGAAQGPWHHGRAALTAFLATPVIGLSQLFIAEAAAAGQHPSALVYQYATWLMVLSPLVSWLILPLLFPFADMAARRFGAAYWLCVPVGAVVGLAVGLGFAGVMIDPFTLGAAVAGAIMGAIYCAALRWFTKG